MVKDMALTPQDTYDHFIGSGALSWSWWYLKESHQGGGDAPDDWYVVVIEDDPDDGDDGEPTGDPIKFNHKALSRAVNTLAKAGIGNRPKYMNVNTIRECQTFLHDPSEADFDADTADQVLQFIAFGEVVYG